MQVDCNRIMTVAKRTRLWTSCCANSSRRKDGVACHEQSHKNYSWQANSKQLRFGTSNSTVLQPEGKTVMNTKQIVRHKVIKVLLLLVAAVIVGVASDRGFAPAWQRFATAINLNWAAAWSGVKWFAIAFGPPLFITILVPPRYLRSPETDYAGAPQNVPWLFMVVLLTANACSEEIFFRWAIQDLLGLIPATIGFALFYVLRVDRNRPWAFKEWRPQFDFIGVPSVAAAGLCLGLARIYNHGNMVPSLLAHIIKNMMVLGIEYLAMREERNNARMQVVQTEQ